MLSKLKDGKIPPGTECPFAEECVEKRAGLCKHHGALHTVKFSCAIARLFDMEHKRRG